MKRKQRSKRPAPIPRRRKRFHGAVKTNKQQRKVKTRKVVKSMSTRIVGQLPLPPHYSPNSVSDVRQVEYSKLRPAALDWRKKHNLPLASRDALRVALLIVDAQYTFCNDKFELYVGGQSGKGAMDDNRRLAEFIYSNLGLITSIAPTMDTHTVMQIFHEFFFVNDKGEHPTPIITPINAANLKSGEWKVNMEVAWSLCPDKTPAAVAKYYSALQDFVVYYCEVLETGSKLPLTIWPYHAMLGGIGHAIVAGVDEACFFHNIARASQTNYQIKGGNPLTENYSILRPEVLKDRSGRAIAQKNAAFYRTLVGYDRVIIAGQAKSHCMAWTIADLLAEIKAQDPELAKKVYLLEDCTSSVAVPNPAGGFYADFTDQANQIFADFAKDGMHLVKSTDPVDRWAGFIA